MVAEPGAGETGTEQTVGQMTNKHQRSNHQGVRVLQLLSTLPDVKAEGFMETEARLLGKTVPGGRDLACGKKSGAPLNNHAD